MLDREGADHSSIDIPTAQERLDSLIDWLRCSVSYDFPAKLEKVASDDLPKVQSPALRLALEQLLKPKIRFG